MKTFTTTTKPSFIIRNMVNKNLLALGDSSEIFNLRGMICVLNIQGFITQSTRSRFNRLILKAMSKKLKLNIYKG
jgi:hypothetical protein